jgi:GNAT superfamily N-acetyltransferase
MILFEKAKSQDAKGLALVSWKSFDNDVNYGAPAPGGPPNYKSDKWQSKMMKVGRYYKIMDDYRIIGGIILFDKGPGHMELGRIFIHPDYQNQGIGSQSIAFIEKIFPKINQWTLDTPVWAKRNQHFYEKHGYVKSGAMMGGRLVCYIKWMSTK